MSQSYTFSTPFTCSDCDEAVPAPAQWEPDAWAREITCPRCGGRMYRAPFAEAVPR